jgi:hypothetical protein
VYSIYGSSDGAKGMVICLSAQLRVIIVEGGGHTAHTHTKKAAEGGCLFFFIYIMTVFVEVDGVCVQRRNEKKKGRKKKLVP